MIGSRKPGTIVIGISSDEDPATIKAASAGRLSLLGNLNGIEMRRWTPEDVDLKVKELIHTAAPGGGFILSDNHGEIPFQTPEETLLAVSDAVLRWGKYPIQWNFMMTGKSFCLQVCKNFSEEVKEALRQEGFSNILIKEYPQVCLNPLIPDAVIKSVLEKADPQVEQVILSEHCVLNSYLESDSRGKEHKSRHPHHCLEMFANRELIEFFFQ